MILDILQIAEAASAKLGQGKKSGSEVLFLCPNHEDREPSLSLNPSKNCFLCGPCGKSGNAWSFAAFLLGVSPDDKPEITAWLKEKGLLNGNGDHRSSGTERKIIKTYSYTDDQGALLYEVVRFEPKDFRQRRPDGNGGWIWNLDGVQRVLYHQAAIPKAHVVFIVEGEKDVEALESLGFRATTNAGGAGKWNDQYSHAFQLHHTVVLIPDNDKPGRDHMEIVGKTLLGKVASIRLLNLEGLPAKGDFSDWLKGREREEAKEELKNLVRAAPEWQPKPQAENLHNEQAQGDGFWLNSAEGDLAKASREAWEALEAANKPPRLFRRGLPIRLERDEDGSPTLKELTSDRLRHELASAASYYRQRGDGSRLPCHPPLAVVRDMLASPDPSLPPLDRIVEAPVFASDGTLDTEPGYHPASRTYYISAPGFSVPSVPENPTDKDMAEAICIIDSDLLRDFPFKGQAEKAHAFALLLQLFARDLIDGPTPLYLIEKPTPGTGASLLVDVLSFPAIGRSPGVLTEGRDEDEWRKRLTAKLVRGEPVVTVDNIRRRLDSSALSAAITSRNWEDRRLGTSENIRIPVRCTFIATGNNPALSAEMSRRSIRIRLDANMDRPWLRNEFKHPDLRNWVAENRARIVWAALVIIRRWIAEGRPVAKDIVKLGMFEAWSEVMAGILSSACIPGFLGNLEEFYDASDAEGAAWRGFVAAWWTRYRESEITISDLFAIVDGLELGDGSERSQKIRLGKQIAQLRDRRFGDLTIRKCGIIRGLQLWKLEKEQ